MIQKKLDIGLNQLIRPEMKPNNSYLLGRLSKLTFYIWKTAPVVLIHVFDNR